MWPAFFIRVRPASRNAKPACMNITRMAVTTTQIVDAAMSRSWFLGIDCRLLQARSGPVVRDVRGRAGPHEPVARLVAAARRVHDRRDDLVDDRVGHDEDEQRLRQEPRLEDAAAVLVGDAALLAVADCLDHGHADVTRCVFDRVDHGLDALADDDRLDLVHRYAATSSSTSAGAPAGATVSIVCRIRPATRYGSASEFGRRSSR